MSYLKYEFTSEQEANLSSHDLKSVDCIAIQFGSAVVVKFSPDSYNDVANVCYKAFTGDLTVDDLTALDNME